MATLHTKIKLYLEANGKTADEMRMGGTIQLASDGTNETIESWNLSDVTKPTDSQIASYETAANTEESNVVVRTTRKTSYGDIGEQLDEIYKDIDAWKARIKKIKDDNPKE